MAVGGFRGAADTLVHPPGMLGYQGGQMALFVRVVLALPRLIAPARRLLEQGLRWGGLGAGAPAPGSGCLWGSQPSPCSHSSCQSA